jgi:hypothetical protein
VTVERVQLVDETNQRPTLRVDSGSATSTSTAANQAILTAGGITVVSGREGSRATASVDPNVGATVTVEPGDRVVVNAGVEETNVEVELSGGDAQQESASVAVTTGGGVAVQMRPVAGSAKVSFRSATVAGVKTPMPTVTSGRMKVEVPRAAPSAGGTGDTPADGTQGGAAGGAGRPFLTFGNSLLESVETASPSGEAGSDLSGEVVVGSEGVVSLYLRSGRVFIHDIAADGRRAAENEPGPMELLYSGETLNMDGNSGQVRTIAVGSVDGNEGVVGDPLHANAITSSGEAGLTIYRIGGVSERLGMGVTSRMAQAMESGGALGGRVEDLGQDVDSGAWRIRYHDSESGVVSLYQGWPVSDLVVEEGPDQLVLNGSMVRLRSGNLAVNLAPALEDADQFASYMAGAGFDQIDVVGSGVIRVRDSEGRLYVGQAGYEVGSASGESGQLLEADDEGLVRWHDGAGQEQTIHPVSISRESLLEVVAGIDADYTIESEAVAGSMRLRIDGVIFEFDVDYDLVPVPAEHIGDGWWLDGERMMVEVPESFIGEPGLAQPWRWRME